MGLLLAHASDGITLGSSASLSGRPLDRDLCLGLALDIVHKTSWRYPGEHFSAHSARRARVLRVFLTALDLDGIHDGGWHDIALEMCTSGELRVLEANTNAAGVQSEGRPRALFALLCHQAEITRMAASADAGWIHGSPHEKAATDVAGIGAGTDAVSGRARVAGSLLASLVAAAELPEHEARVLADAFGRAHADALETLGEGLAMVEGSGDEAKAGSEDFEVVDAMQLDR